LETDPLLTGPIFYIDLGIGNSLSMVMDSWVLSDATGDPDEFIMYENFFINFDSASNTYTISGTPVPIPSSLMLLGGGICALFGITRRKKIR